MLLKLISFGGKGKETTVINLKLVSANIWQ